MANGSAWASHLLIACLHTEEDDVGSSTGQASLQVRLAPNLLRLGIVVIQHLHRVLEESPFDLPKRVGKKV